MSEQQKDRRILQLAGVWKYVLDPEDIGESEQWYDSFVPGSGETVSLPGTLTVNGIGEAEQWGDTMDRESIRSLRQRYRYIGAAWYETEIDIPADCIDRRFFIFLERVMFQSTLWVNGKLAGQQDSLSAPHEYEVSTLIEPGKVNRFTLRIDNRDVQNLGTHSSAYTEETQTIWNGVIGRMELHALEPYWINNVHIYPRPDLRSVIVKGTCHNTKDAMAHFQLNVRASIKQGTALHVGDEITEEVSLPASSAQNFQLEYPMGQDPLLWDEFTPNLYEMKVEGTIVLDEHNTVRVVTHQTFGLRYFNREGKILKMNGRAVFLRGTLECCIFPHTGHPPMDIASWQKIFQTAKEYGLNHIRFHSWCPPEVAFEAADQLGIYLQVESPMWMDTWNMAVGTHPEHYTYLPQEARRIVEVYGNHPSFCIYSNGNELNGDFELLHQMVAELKVNDDRRLYTLTTNWDRPLDPADDLFIAQSVDGIGVRGQYFPDKLALSTELDFREAVAARSVPVISHEVGQYAVYPDVQEIEKYTGALRPVNLEAIRADMEKRGLAEDIRSFVHGTGMFAMQLYRDEIEAALRTPSLGGFQLLDLHDFPGQSTATVGILNAFWESKGLIEPHQFREFCAPTVLLLRMPKRIYTNTEQFAAEINISHFAATDIPPSSIQWVIKNSDGQILDQGSLQTNIIPNGSGQSLGNIVSLAPQYIKKSDRLTIFLEILGSEVRNEWPFWVYESPEKHSEFPQSIMVKRSLDDEMEQHLTAGGHVLFLAQKGKLQHTSPGKFYPVFWSPAHFATEAPCGILAHTDHQALNGLPTREYAEHPWQDLLDQSVSFVVNEGIPFNPIVQVIPNFYHNRKLTNLAEYNVGQGKVLICGINIEADLQHRPVADQLRTSLIDYVSSDSFEPTVEIELDQLRQLLAESEQPAETASDSTVAAEELAHMKVASSDSVSEGHEAMYGNDRSSHTYWLAEDDAPGHWWQVDLLHEHSITGTKVEFYQEGNFLYVIQVSGDGQQWSVVSNQTGQTSTELTRVDRFEAKGRYVRIVYNGLPSGVRAGHRAFEVYGS
ncbi:sugar-binding domain-containing protein [Paenibacillus xylanexedens]|uniref:sugar-binding domain-containing protein n=1 Tax=Paenibacillus xylanexedens TaxID=528191 RepID=UPI0011A31B81|nr:sugar-binding domain-containing protein [Paenibacillus xylanexedens]